MRHESFIDWFYIYCIKHTCIFIALRSFSDYPAVSAQSGLSSRATCYCLRMFTAAFAWRWSFRLWARRWARPLYLVSPPAGRHQQPIVLTIFLQLSLPMSHWRRRCAWSTCSISWYHLYTWQVWFLARYRELSSSLWRESAQELRTAFGWLSVDTNVSYL